MQFETLVSNIISFSKFEKTDVVRWHQFWKSLLVNFDSFHHNVRSHPPRWSCHPIIAKYYLFASFWCISRLFLSNSLRTMSICVWRFPWAMHSGSAGRYRCQKFFNSTCLILSSRGLSSRNSPRQEYDNDVLPMFIKHLCLGTPKHDSAQLTRSGAWLLIWTEQETLLSWSQPLQW